MKYNLLFILVLLLASLACSMTDILPAEATATPVPPPTATLAPPATEPETASPITENENGWQTFTQNEFNFSISLPENWMLLDLTSSDLEELLSDVTNANPDFGDVFSSESLQAQAAAGIKLMALDLSTLSTESGSSMSVVASELPVTMSLSNITELNITQLKALLGEDVAITQETVNANGMEMTKLTYQTPFNDPSGVSFILHYMQMIAIHGKMQYVLTFTSTPETYQEQEAAFDEIVNTFQVLE